jgi:hypothetical protein
MSSLTPEWINAIASAAATIIALVALVHSIFTRKRVSKLEKNQSTGGAGVANNGNGVVNIIGQTHGGSAQMDVSRK